MENLNIEQAEKFKVLKIAAEGGNISAMLELSECYKKGIGTTPDLKLANYWHDRANGFSKNVSIENN